MSARNGSATNSSSLLPLAIASAGVAVSGTMAALAYLWMSGKLPLGEKKRSKSKSNRQASDISEDESKSSVSGEETNNLSRKVRKSDELDMSELATFIKVSQLLKREQIIPPEGPYPNWWLKIKSMLSLGAKVHEIPLDHRLPILEKGSAYASEALQELENCPDDVKALGNAYAHIALGLFRSCFYELFPDSDLTVFCYLVAAQELASKGGIPQSDTLRISCFAFSICNALRKTRTGSTHMTPEKIAKLSKLALSVLSPRNPQAPTQMEIQKYCTLMLAISSASLFCRSFQVAAETLTPLLSELERTIPTDDGDMVHQFIDAHIIMARCLTEEKKNDEAKAILKKMTDWLDKKMVRIAPQKIVACLNRWRPELSSNNNSMLWCYVTAYQLKLVESNRSLFEVDELCQLMVLLAAHLCHATHYEQSLAALKKALDIAIQLGPQSAAGTLGTLQISIIQAWAQEGLAKKEKNHQKKLELLKKCWNSLKDALNHPGQGGYVDEHVQIAIMAKMAWVGALLPADAVVVATLKSFYESDGIKEFVEDAKLQEWAATLPNDLITPYWGLSF